MFSEGITRDRAGISQLETPPPSENLSRRREEMGDLRSTRENGEIVTPPTPGANPPPSKVYHVCEASSGGDVTGRAREIGVTPTKLLKRPRKSNVTVTQALRLHYVTTYLLFCANKHRP